jgi:two-component system cell cycle sensor histidine kinase/response regulator CckA
VAHQPDIHRLVVEHALDLVAVLDEDDRIVYASPSHAPVLGHAPEALVGRSPLTLVHPEDVALVRSLLGRTGGPGPHVRLRHRDGRWVHVEGRIDAVPGEPLRILVARDVTARTRAERRRDAQYAVTRVLAAAASLEEAAPEAMRAVADRLDWDVGVLWEGEGVRRAALWHRDDLAAEDVAALSRFAGLPARVWASGEPDWVPDVLADRDAGTAGPGRLHAAVAVPVGSWGVLELAGRKPRRPDADRLDVFASFGAQLCQFLERTRAEAALRDNRALLAAVLESTTDPIFVKDRQGRYLLVNQAGARGLGLPVERVLGADDRALVPPEAAAESAAGDRRVMATGEPVTHETVVPGPDGPRRFQVTKAPYRDEAGELAGVVGIAFDVTEQRRLEAELRQAQKMEAVGRLAGGVAHDFNTILAVIRGFGDLARRRLAGTDPTVDEWLEQVSRATDRGTALTRQLLAVSRREPLETERLDVNAVVAEMDALLRRVLGADLRLVTVFGASPGTVELNRGQLEQVVMNLAVNARDAMAGTGKLTIETADVQVGPEAAARLNLRPGPHVALRVSDTGPGMDEETRSRIFEPFFTTKRTGTGLGLATVYAVVTAAGGHVGVQSAPGAGASFAIHLPAAGTAIHAERRAAP